MQAISASSSRALNGGGANALSGAIAGFIDWLESYGPDSYDHQTYFTGAFGAWAKALYYRHRVLGTLAVAPMILSEAFVPVARGLFGPRLRFPIADAHYAMGFARLAALTEEKGHFERAVNYLNALIQSRCPDYQNFCWGYPFDWVTRTGVMTRGTPLITTTPYVYEAFAAVHEIDGDQKWRQIMQSIADHALLDIPDREVSANSSAAGYNPMDTNGVVVNASAYRAFLLIAAARQFNRDDYKMIGLRNLNFVLSCQQSDGSWFYATDGVRNFIDHFHTCFVLKALAKIERLEPNAACTHAIDAGLDYYANNLFDEQGLPKPFASAPRLTVYRRELYDYAECLNLGSLLASRSPLLAQRLATTLRDLFGNWRKRDGSFRSRRLTLGWDNVPMHRWAQAQLFRSLCLLLPESRAAGAISH